MGVRHSLRRGPAFASALIATPLIVGAVGGVFVLLGDLSELELFSIIGFLLLMSVAFGGLSYLLVGGVMFWRAASRGASRAYEFAFAAFMANFISAALTLALAGAGYVIFDRGDTPQSWIMIPLIVHAFGLLFAPAYGLLFGWIFTFLANDLSPTSKPLEDVEAVFR